jgi:hypothetical protein
MSSTPYVAMATPKKGLRTIDARGMEFTGRPFEDSGNMLTRLLLGPFESLQASLSAVFALRTLLTMFFVFLGSLVYGTVFVFAQSNALTAGTELFLRSVLLGLIAMSMFYVTSVWTYYDDLPTIIYPAHSMALVSTAVTNSGPTTIGLIIALCYGIFQFGGYAAAGGIVRALNVTTTPLQNSAGLPAGLGSSNTYWLYWFGATVIAFSYIYNRVFKQKDESVDRAANDRASKAAAIAIFGLTVAFYSLGLNSYSSGVYVTQTIAANGLYPISHAGDTVVQWAFYIWVDLLAVPATVLLLTIVVWLMFYGAEKYDGPNRGNGKVTGADGSPIDFGSSSNAQVNSNVSSRLGKRQISVQY